ncbi:hypothetical protein GCM10028827_22170 [Mucilaginibacter myungsuensis]|uniref:DUF922 domain-containing protein n=1 Tax=Mucilaginibacter myungsuensis TaxID=649104 RepID=A0A929KW47_9SPHI|nr:DUF922 domain-containing protein [Mucilaginibacter myungsuensis]MBE9660998.1 DUF922 domain-containing protein [Mucilaginibacter myungsuensis]
MAFTHVDVGYSYDPEFVDGNYKLRFKVENNFLKKTSWVQKDKQTENLLGHEQLHFDINEYFTRKLYWELTNKSYTANYQQEVRDIFASITKRLTAQQLQYDLDTKHSIDREKQADWEAVVKQQLTETPTYP